MDDIKKYITGIVNLKDKQKLSETHYRQHWHIYFTNCNNFSEIPMGALIEENIIQNISTFKIIPFGFIPEGHGYLSMRNSGIQKSNSITDKLKLLKQHTDIEIENILYRR